MNSDPESIKMIPQLEISLTDKLMLLKANPTHYSVFPEDEDVAGELPYFCAYLRDYKMSAHVVGGGRFGVKPYHHPD